MEYPEVIRVFATKQSPDYESPWQTRPPRASTGSAVVISKNQVLTGAHVVAHATFIQIQKQSNPDKAIAKIRAINHDCDLALLEVIEPIDFLADIEPASLGAMPTLRQDVAVVGYPIGGEEISITEGVVSRIEVQTYSHSQRDLVAVTVDAAINSGNSGGPVLPDGAVVGIAFQKLSNADNIGEMVPPPIIRTFLDGVAAGRPSHTPGVGIITQTLENPTLRKQLGMSRAQSGVLVTWVAEGSGAAGVLAPRDVITAIDGCSIANNGTIQYLGKHRTSFEAVLGNRYVGDQMPFEVLRNGQPMALTVTLGRAQYLVPRTSYDELPPFFIWGGLVCQVLTREYLRTWDKWWNKAPKEFLHLYYYGKRTSDRREVIIITQVLADEINQGYGEFHNEVIAQVNGRKPASLRDLAAILDAAEGIVELTIGTGAVMAFEAAAVRQASDRIKQRYRLPVDRNL